MKQWFNSATTGLLLLFTMAAVGSNISQDPDVDLMDLSLEQLMQINVTGVSKKTELISEAPGVVSTVSQEEIDLFGDRTLHNLLQRQPSIYTRTSNMFAHNLAGFRGNVSSHGEFHTLILFNGRPMRETSLGYNYPIYTAFPLLSLDSVELIRGPGSVLYGSNAVTGVVNLKTQQAPEEFDLHFKSLGGSYDYYDQSLSGKGHFGKLGFVGSLRAAGQQGYDYELRDAAGIHGSDNFHERSFSGMMSLSYGDFVLDVFLADIDIFSMGVFPLWSNAHRTSNVTRLFTNLGYKKALHEAIDLELNLTYNLQEDSLTSPGAKKIGTNMSDILGEITVYLRPLEDLDLTLGYLAEHRSNYRPDDDHVQVIPDYRYDPQSAYAQVEYDIHDKIKLISGLQWHRSAQKEMGNVLRQGIILTPYKNWGLKFLYGEAFRAPIALESDLAFAPFLVGNPELSPEETATTDVQVFYQDENTYAAGTYFYTRIDNWIVLEFGKMPYAFNNVGSAEFRGVELEFKRYLTKQYYVLGSWLHQEHETNSDIDPTVAPEDMVKLGAAADWGWGSGALYWTYFGQPNDSQSIVNWNPDPEDIHLVSLNLNFDLSKELRMERGNARVILKIENLLDEEVFQPSMAYNETPNSFPYNPGRTFYAGLQLKF